MAAFVKDYIVYRNDIQCRIGRQVGDKLQIEKMETGELVLEYPSTLLHEYRSGTLLTVPRRAHIKRDSSATAFPAVLPPQKSEASRIESRRRVDYISRLEDREAFGGPRNNLRLAIAEVARERGEEKPPHDTTVYRWRKDFLKAQRDVRALLSQIGMRGGKDKSRLHPLVEAIIHDKIESVYLSSKCGSAEEVHDAVFLAIQHENTTRIESEWLEVPGFRTVQRRISEIYGFDIAVARYGLKEAERRYGFVSASRRVRRILELVEIDHTPVDIMVVDEKRVVIGRPTITVVLDRYSRCVLGYHLSLAGHGVPAVFEAIRHALLPKTYIRERFPDSDLVWECYGWFERLLEDNGKELISNAVIDAMQALGIIVELAGSRQPNDKAFVERFNRTFNYSFIHRLPGTTLSKLYKRIGFKAEDDACMTMEELDSAIHFWIMGVYHLRPHLGLGRRAPIEVWKEGAAAHPPQLKANAEDIDVEFAEITTSCVQHYGIDLNTYRYASPRLAMLRRMLPEKKTRVDVKWPRNDIGKIYVYDPFEKDYFPVPNVDPDFNGLTLEQGKAVKKKRESDDHYKRTRAESAEMVREMGKEAAADKKLKRRRNGARFNNQTSKDLHRPKTAPLEPQSSEAADQSQPKPKKVFVSYGLESMSNEGEQP